MKKQAENYNLTSVQALVKLDQPEFDTSVNGKALAKAANFSRSYFHRRFQQEIGESPIHCRRRLLLERAGFQLVHSELPVTQIAFEAGFGSLEGFSRAFRREVHLSPRQYRKSGPLSWYLPAPNDIHYDPIIGAALRHHMVGMEGEKMDLTDRLTDFDTWITRRILESARSLSDETLDAPLAGYDNPLLYSDGKKTLRDMLDRLVFTKEVWMASIHGRPMPENLDQSVEGMLGRMDAAFSEFSQLVKKVRDENLWETSFMDMLCDPPEAFTYGGMISHVATFSAYRRTIAVEVLSRVGIDTLGYGDPMEWKR